MWLARQSNRKIDAETELAAEMISGDARNLNKKRHVDRLIKFERRTISPQPSHCGFFAVESKCAVVLNNSYFPSNAALFVLATIWETCASVSG